MFPDAFPETMIASKIWIRKGNKDTIFLDGFGFIDDRYNGPCTLIPLPKSKFMSLFTVAPQLTSLIVACWIPLVIY
jgi:hypothetical protein